VSAGSGAGPAHLRPHYPGPSAGSAGRRAWCRTVWTLAHRNEQRLDAGVSPLPKARKISAKPPANAQNATMSTSTSAVGPGRTRAITPAARSSSPSSRWPKTGPAVAGEPPRGRAGDAAGPQKPGHRLGILQTRTRSSRADRSGVGDVRGSSRRVAAAAGPEKGLKAIAQTRQRTLKMNETCDRCGPAIRAVYRVTRNGELYLCGHCAKRLWPALSAQGWGVHGHAPGGRSHPGRALASAVGCDPGRLGLVCPC
jgi:hypothetical protein